MSNLFKVKSGTSAYGLIIKTNKYTGNFERQLCAYITGSVGECLVGSEEAQDYNAWAEEQDLDFNLCDYTVLVPDDKGCHRPVSMYQNDKNRYHDIIIYLEDPLEDEHLDAIMKRLKMYTEMREKEGPTADLYNRDSLEVFQVIGMTQIHLVATIEQELISSHLYSDIKNVK